MAHFDPVPMPAYRIGLPQTRKSTLQKRFFSMCRNVAFGAQNFPVGL